MSEGVFISAADEVQNWISRGLLTHHAEDREGLQAVIDEFRTNEELVILKGGVVGDNRISVIESTLPKKGFAVHKRCLVAREVPTTK